MKEAISSNLMDLHGRIAEVCEQHDRDIKDITIVAISKTQPASLIQTAVAAGLLNIGESRIQEAEPKILELGPIARYHLVGHLQTNKVRKAVQLFDVIQSVDSIRLAEEISRRAVEIDRTMECFIQVNSSGEQSKYGVSPDDTPELIRHVAELPNIDLSGLMSIGPLANDENEIRAAFRLCRELFREGQAIVTDGLEHLSIGMTDDFPLAIAEGATMIRIGTGIFGTRRF